MRSPFDRAFWRGPPNLFCSYRCPHGSVLSISYRYLFCLAEQSKKLNLKLVRLWASCCLQWRLMHTPVAFPISQRAKKDADPGPTDLFGEATGAARTEGAGSRDFPHSSAAGRGLNWRTWRERRAVRGRGKGDSLWENATAPAVRGFIDHSPWRRREMGGGAGV